MTLRKRLIKLAHEKPELRKDLLPLLKVARTKRVTVTIEDDERIQGYGTFYAGDYLVEMPANYDEDEVGAEDIVFDGAITVIREL